MILVKIFSVLWMFVEDFWKPVLGYTFIGIGLTALAFMFPWVLILYAIGIGAKLVDAY